MSYRFFIFIPSAIIACIPMEPFEGQIGVTFPTPPAECQEITKGTTDVILTPSGTQLDQTTVTVSCPAGTRVKIDNQVLTLGATGTLTCSAGGWLDGTTSVSMVSCDPVCNPTPTELSGYFYSISSGINWMDAEQNCYSQGGHLFSVQSQADNDFLLSLSNICSSGSLWIGGHRYLDNPPFVWTDNSPFTYTNWATGSPNTGAATTHCILFNSPSGDWTDSDCYSSASFVCRYSSLTPTVQMSPATCPAGWTAMTLCGTSACYFLSTVSATWANAQAACQAFGINAQLASIHCQAEQDFIKNTILPFPIAESYAWIGAFRTGGLFDFSWVDGTPYNYMTYDLGEPSNFLFREFCLHITYGVPRPATKWNDNRCSRSFPYLCKTVL